MNIFESFPDKAKCKLCGANEPKKTVLVPIDGTRNGNIEEAIPIHLDCILNLNLRYSPAVNSFYFERTNNG